MDRSERRVNHRATKEVFYDVMAVAGQSAFAAKGGFYGGDIDGDDETAYIQGFVPHDFAKLKDLKIVLIPNVAVAAMTFRVTTNYCRPNEPYTQHSKTFDASFLAALNVLTEIDITESVNLFNGRLAVQDQLGIAFSRVAGQNTDAIVIGARMKYYV